MHTVGLDGENTKTGLLASVLLHLSPFIGLLEANLSSRGEIDFLTVEIQKQKQAISGQHLLVGTLLGQCHGVQGCIEPVSEDRLLRCNGLHQPTGQSPIHCAVETGRELWVWALEHSLFLRALHVPGLDNRGTDLMLRVGPLSDEWRLHASVMA